MKKNNKGFVLAETLVVTVFVMLIFTIIYANFYPILGKYQEREFFDDIDSKYNAYWIKRFLQDEDILPIESWEVIKAHIDRYGGYEFTCNSLSESYEAPYAGCPLIRDRQYKEMVQSYFEIANVVHLYITKYNLEKSAYITDSTPSVQFKGKEGTPYIKRFSTPSKVAQFNLNFGRGGPNENTRIPHPSGITFDYWDYDIFLFYHVPASVNQQTKRYIDYLPAYKFPSKRQAKYRIIVEFSRINDDSKDTTNNNYIHTFTTMELKR